MGLSKNNHLNKHSLPLNILISQPKPETDKSPYFDLASKHNVSLTFYPFIEIQSIHLPEFRKQKINISSYNSVILTTKNAIEQYFRMCEEQFVKHDEGFKYFCITESLSHYLQKFIPYRKRRIFFGVDGSNQSLFEVLNKHKPKEKFLYVCSENQQDNEIVNWLKDNSFDHKIGFMYRTISRDIKNLFLEKPFHIICFFTPSGIKSLIENFPEFIQNDTIIGTYGNNTLKAAEEAKLEVAIQSPLPKSLSMAAALDNYLSENVIQK